MDMRDITYCVGNYDIALSLAPDEVLMFLCDLQKLPSQGFDYIIGSRAASPQHLPGHCFTRSE
ncbi:hypothetical protein B7P02_15815 [Bordetella bronchiseptica]|nr:hypothetical protein B7P02_15815 [Bordetella bronchiseptica]